MQRIRIYYDIILIHVFIMVESCYNRNITVKNKYLNSLKNRNDHQLI